MLVHALLVLGRKLCGALDSGSEVCQCLARDDQSNGLFGGCGDELFEVGSGGGVVILVLEDGGEQILVPLDLVLLVGGQTNARETGIEVHVFWCV